jgi:type II secretory pathway component GspD/PulD (secretin)
MQVSVFEWSLPPSVVRIHALISDVDRELGTEIGIYWVRGGKLEHRGLGGGTLSSSRVIILHRVSLILGRGHGSKLDRRLLS